MKPLMQAIIIHKIIALKYLALLVKISGRAYVFAPRRARNCRDRNRCSGPPAIQPNAVLF
jgi:hypothetical protein